MAPERPVTRVERTYDALRTDILAGRHEPGAKLPFADLSPRYDASVGVLREALSRLAAEGLVESVPQLGFRVRSLSVEDLRHLTDARCAIETLVLREALANGGVAWESQVLAAHHQLQHTPQMSEGDPARLSDEWARAHAAYHDALLMGCPNPRLLAIARSLRDSAELYRRWSVPFDPTHRDIASEHRTILEAVLAHDEEAAVAALTRHIRYTTDVLLRHVEGGAVDAARG
ncbi:GntR family transcriptional regulator [Amycolatopsis cynarae]|uniref:GntR family transcriptional regulator n=1 Tax=Amycolatopsis cynarae TaxID=2995223 RepID=A0ABY7B956_9PSEU|nr:GntR family transcriptional regulator [Amycolatopsis sp. HUAS 11-8]WAL67777.1 GntR family transcriptional regulator [Amycolatopsis sp. HUAS 11-8]